jgi:integrase/recombinase XerD
MKQAMTLTDAQQKRVIKYCATRRHPSRDMAIVLFSLHTGLRAMEIAALKLCDVFDEEGSIKSQFQLAQRNTKGGNARTVFLNTKLRKVLKNYGEQSDLKKLQLALFPSQKGGHFSANTMCQLFLDIYKACGFEHASSHSGRRTFITKLANSGVNVRLLAALAGHQHISVTQRYIDVNDTQLANAVELL